MAARKTRRFLILFVLAAAGCAALWWFWPTEIKGPEYNIAFEIEEKIVGRAVGTAPLPLLIALHGNGDTPRGFYSSLIKDLKTPARVILVRGPVDYEAGGGRLFGTAWPEREDEVKLFGDALASALRTLDKKYVIAGKPVVTGFSGGAQMAYYLAGGHGRQFSYVLPVSGRLRQGDASLAAANNHGVKVIAFHGRADKVIPYSAGFAANKILTRVRVHVEWNEWKGGHLAVFGENKADYLKLLTKALEAQTKPAPY